MAIFEKSSETKSVLDDTEKLICTIENAQNINKHTEYILRVQRGPSKENKWKVSRRYRDFAALHSSLQQANIDLPLPPKKLIGNMQPSFVAERQIALQKYIDEVLKHQVLCLTLQVRCFLDPINYSVKLADQALQTVSIALRGDGRFELKGPLADIGWRIRKHYFLVTDAQTKENCILSWQNYGCDRYLCDKDLQTTFKIFQNISHPYIDEILAINSLETSAYVVRKIHPNGSIRDMIYGTDYSKNHLMKYGNPKIRKPLTCGQIALYGHQILQAIKFLLDKTLSYGHIHPGNITIVNQRAVLTDIENCVMGAACLYRPHLLQLKHWSDAECVAAHCFGRTLYEMAFATPLEQTYCDTYPNEISEDLECVLRMCLSSASCRRGAVTLSDLLYHPFFTRARLPAPAPAPVSSNGERARAHLKLPLSLKAELNNALDAIEARLRKEQKLVRHSKREVRIQEILNSEEEMKKQRRKARKRDSVWKSTSSLAETLRSHSASTASSPTPPHTSADTSAATPARAEAEAEAETASPPAARSSPPAARSSTPAARSSTPAARSSPPAARSSPPDARSALLHAICAFDKTRLARVAAHQLPGRA